MYVQYVSIYTKHQRGELCRQLGRSCLEGLGTTSRILRGSLAIFVLSRNFAVTYTLFGYFCVNLPDFLHFSVDLGNFWTDYRQLGVAGSSGE